MTANPWTLNPVIPDLFRIKILPFLTSQTKRIFSETNILLRMKSIEIIDNGASEYLKGLSFLPSSKYKCTDCY